MTTVKPDRDCAFTFADAERAHLRDRMRLSASAKIDFFEEMIELAYRSGALRADRPVLTDAPAAAAEANPALGPEQKNVF